MFDALSQVARELARRNGKKVLVLFTDGQDNASVLNAEAAMNRARRVGVPVYAVAQGEALASPALVQVEVDGSPGTRCERGKATGWTEALSLGLRAAAGRYCRHQGRSFLKLNL